MTGFPLPPGTPEKDIAHIKLMAIFIQSNGSSGNAASELTFHIENTQGGDAGYELRPGENPDDVIESFLSEKPLTRTPTPLDFPISKKCYIVLKLEGDFWEFDKIGVTTKKDLNGQYYELRFHPDTGRPRAVSFCAKAPFPDKDRVRHSINLHVDFLDRDSNGRERRLPVIIDPDIENRGG